MIRIKRFENLQDMKLSWLHARYHYSFFNSNNLEACSISTIRLIKDDAIRAGGGFDTHHHKDIEIINFIRKGAITHKDSEGNQGRTTAGNVQVMSAGSGIFHSEYNLESEDKIFYQIWIEPHTKGMHPNWNNIEITDQFSPGELPLLVSGRKEDENRNALHINQFAAIYGGQITKEAAVTHQIKDQAYLLVSDGLVGICGERLHKGDSAEILDEKTIEVFAISESEVVLIDAPAAS